MVTMYMLVAFGERSETLRLLEALRARYVNCSVINTPREISVGCGLSVKFEPKDLSRVQTALSAMRKKSFKGIFKNVRGAYSRMY